MGTGIAAGVAVTKFQLADDIFDNGTINEKNRCYQNDLPSGLQVGGSKEPGITPFPQNVTQCKMRAPAYLSRPHFYKADPFFRK